MTEKIKYIGIMAIGFVGVFLYQIIKFFSGASRPEPLEDGEKCRKGGGEHLKTGEITRRRNLRAV